MKKKVVIALIATLTLTLGTFGTAFAMNSNPVIELQDNEIFSQDGENEGHTHTWGDETYTVTKPAEYEQIKVVDKEAVYEQIKVVDKEAVYEQIKVVDQEAWDEKITEVQTICFSCEDKGIHTQFVNSQVVGTGESLSDHVKAHMLNGESGAYGSREVVVDTIHHDEVFHYENGALISPEEYHYENGALISPEEYHYENGALISPEEGHWEHTCSVCGEIQNKDTGEVIKPGTLPDEPENPNPDDPTTEEPENPNPDDPTTEEPENPNPDDPTTEEPENPNTGDQTETPNEDTQNPTDETETDNNKQDQQDNDKATTTDTTDKSENTDTATTVSNENKAPQTGDTASMIYLATLAGSAVTGGTAFGLRRKIKK